MAVRKSKRSLLETTLITIVRFGLSVKRTLSTTVNSIKTRRKKPELKAEVKAVDLKLESSLAKYKLKFEDIKPPKLKLTKKGKK
jgi:hypothetical protein